MTAHGVLSSYCHAILLIYQKNRSHVDSVNWPKMATILCRYMYIYYQAYNRSCKDLFCLLYAFIGVHGPC